MSIFALSTLLAVSTGQGALVTEMADTFEPRYISQGGQVVGSSVVLIETVNGEKHFFSHTETRSTVTEVDSWSEADGTPIKSTYAAYTGDKKKLLLKVDVTLDGKKLTMDRQSSDESLNATYRTELPGGVVPVFAQFDPLKVSQNFGSDGKLHVSVIDPIGFNVSPCTITEEPPAKNGTRVFDIKGEAGLVRTGISASGNFAFSEDTGGQTNQPTPWTDTLLAMASNAGLRYTRQMVLGSSVGYMQITSTPTTGVRGRG